MTPWRVILCRSGIFAVAVVCAACLALAPARGTTSKSRQPGFRVFDVSDGLSQSQVEAVVQDSDGYIWLATRHGLSRFDGHRFQTYLVDDGLFDNQVSSATAGTRGEVWFGHLGGGLTSVVDGSLRAYAIPFPGAPRPVNTLAVDSRSHLWIGTEGAGLAVRSPAGHVDFLSPEALPERTIGALAAREGHIWAGAAGGLWRGDARAGKLGTFERIDTPLAGPVDALFFDSHGWLWVGSRDGRLAAIPRPEAAEPGWYGPWSGEDGMPGSAVTGISEDRRGRLWVATAFDGAVSLQVDPGSGMLTEVVPRTVEHGLGYPQINAIFRDREANLWIGTTQGLTLYTGSEFATFAAGDTPLEKNVWAIHLCSDGLLWFGTDGGLFGLEILPDGNQRLRHELRPADGLGHRTVLALLEEPRGGLWAATRGGLTYVDESRERAFNLGTEHGLPSVELRALARGPKGRIWIGFRDDGVAIYTPPDELPPTLDNPGTFERVAVDEDGALGVSVYALLKDSRGRMWAGTEGMGLLEYEDVGDAPGHFAPVHRSQGLAHPNVNDIVEDGLGRLWLGCDNGGFYVYDGRRFTDVAAGHAISRENVYLVEVSSDNAILVGTNRGLYRYEPELESYVHYGRTEGFVGLETNVHARHRDSEGRVWIGTITGAVLYDPVGAHVSRELPTVSITGVEVGFEPVSPKEEARFAYSRNRITFEFLGILMRAPEHVQYRYKLEGFDSDWSPPTPQTSASYANLPPGRYVFRVTATNRSGTRASEPAVYGFTILAPFWMTWWFYIGAFTCAILAVGGLVHWRLRNVESTNKRLESMVDQRTEELSAREADLERANTALESALQGAQAAAEAKSAFLATMSHEIRTPMNAVLGMADLLRDDDLSDSQRESVEIIHSSGRALLAIINDVLDLSKIEAGQVTLESIPFSPRELTSQVVALLANRCQIKGIDMVWSVTSDVPNMCQGDPHRLRQILTNLVGNAIKFTDRGYVAIRVDAEVDPEGESAPLTFEVLDSGIGVSQDAAARIFEPFSQQESSFARKYGGTGLGLTICRQLVELMDGSIGVESREGAGSRFWFTAELGVVHESREPELPWLGDRTVLLEVHSSAAAELLRERLVDAGARVISADDMSASDHADVAVIDGPNAVESAESAAERPGLREARIIALRRAHAASVTHRGRIAVVGRPLDVERVVALSAGTDPWAPVSERSAPRREETVPWEGAHVLVVDDSLINLKVSQKMLEGLSCRVTCAASGADAIALCRGEDFDLILMDIQMPGMDGFETTRRLRELERCRDVKVVALTANAMQGDRERCLAEGMDDYVAKPCERDQLRRVLDTWVTPRTVLA